MKDLEFFSQTIIPICGDMSRDFLGRHFEVEAVADGEAALISAKANPPALVLSDVMMPQLDGFGLVKAIRADASLRETPIVLLSARAGEEAKIDGLGTGADDYLVKPFSARELVARVTTNLKMSRVRIATEQALRKRTVELQTVLQMVPTAIWFTNDPDAKHVSGNWQAANLLRLDRDANASLTAQSGERPEFRVFCKGRELAAHELPIQRAARGEEVDEQELDSRFPNGDRKTVLMRATALQGASGEGQGAVSAAVDITERKQYEERLKLLLNQLNHRVKNTLATVQSLAMQTLRNGGGTGHARLQFEGRLIALSKAHDILTQESWEGAPLRKIVGQAILPFAGERLDRFKIRGPDVQMPPKSALALAIALHELCTNAVEYRFLSSETGYVHVDRTATAEGSKQLQAQWNEVGGPGLGLPRAEASAPD